MHRVAVRQRPQLIQDSLLRGSGLQLESGLAVDRLRHSCVDQVLQRVVAQHREHRLEVTLGGADVTPHEVGKDAGGERPGVVGDDLPGCPGCYGSVRGVVLAVPLPVVLVVLVLVVLVPEGHEAPS